MKQLIICLLVAPASFACAPITPPPAPVEICSRTTLDEKTGIGFEAAYKAFRLVVETGVDVGLIHGEKAAKLRNINTTLFNLTLAEQAAYLACNSTSYQGAINEGMKVLQAGYQVLGE